jgi:iron-sulfur cluster assembly protein
MNLNIPVTITEKALQEIKLIRATKKIPEEYGLRMGVKGGTGCSGISFILGFDLKKNDDKEYQVGDQVVYISKKDVMFLAGKKVDYYSENDAYGFSFVDDLK